MKWRVVYDVRGGSDAGRHEMSIDAASKEEAVIEANRAAALHVRGSIAVISCEEEGNSDPR